MDWVIMMCQCRIILGKNCAILASDINHGRCYACVGAVGIQEIPVLPSQFCYKPKTALKKYFLKKKKDLGKKACRQKFTCQGYHKRILFLLWLGCQTLRTSKLHLGYEELLCRDTTRQNQV